MNSDGVAQLCAWMAISDLFVLVSNWPTLSLAVTMSSHSHVRSSHASQSHTERLAELLANMMPVDSRFITCSPPYLLSLPLDVAKTRKLPRGSKRFYVVTESSVISPGIYTDWYVYCILLFGNG